MLSYRHGFHAGSYADVLKHLVLVRILDHLVRKPTGVRYIDSHAGAGGYLLDTPEAQKTREYAEGIGLLWDAENLPDALQRYVAAVRQFNPGPELTRYPGSPWLAHRLLRNQDRLELFELHPRDFAALARRFARARNVHCHHTDGFAGSLALVPPVERRGLVLIDPSYELKEDYDRVVAHVKALHRRFATGVYMVWWPVVDARRSRRMESAWRSSGLKRISLYQLNLAAPGTRPGLTGTSVTLVNAPWGVSEDVGASLRFLKALLGGNDQASYRCEELS